MDQDKINLRFIKQAKSKTFNNILDIFELKSKKVLDIGCSYGEFLSHFAKDSLGLTISDEELQYGKNRGLNMKILNIENEELVGEEKSFYVIFANNIFEHLHSPHPFLCNIKKYLKNDGLLILGVPCIPSFKPLLKLSKFRGSMASSHINFFTKYSLENTVLRAGWDIVFARGFYFRNSFVDSLFNCAYPHFYIVAKINPDFQYSDKRAKELLGYK